MYVKKNCWIFSAIAASLNLAIWVSMVILGGGYLGFLESASWQQVLLQTLVRSWDFLNAPVNAFIAPYVLDLSTPYMIGFLGLLRELAYVAFCMLWIGAFTFLIVMLTNRLAEQLKRIREH